MKKNILNTIAALLLMNGVVNTSSVANWDWVAKKMEEEDSKAAQWLLTGVTATYASYILCDTLKLGVNLASATNCVRYLAPFSYPLLMVHLIPIATYGHCTAITTYIANTIAFTHIEHKYNLVNKPFQWMGDKICQAVLGRNAKVGIPLTLECIMRFVGTLGTSAIIMYTLNFYIHLVKSIEVAIYLARLFDHAYT